MILPSGKFLLGNRVKKSYPYFAIFASKLEPSLSIGPGVYPALGKLDLLVNRNLVKNVRILVLIPLQFPF